MMKIIFSSNFLHYAPNYVILGVSFIDETKKNRLAPFRRDLMGNVELGFFPLFYGITTPSRVNCACGCKVTMRPSVPPADRTIYGLTKQPLFIILSNSIMLSDFIMLWAFTLCSAYFL